MMRKILTSLTLLALCGCDAAEKNAIEPTDAAGNAINYVADVEALSEPQRNAVFFRAMRDVGLPCQHVTGAEQIAAPEKAPMWRARCENGAAHLIQLLPDGTANVVSRATP